METLTPTELRVGFQYGLEIGRTIRLGPQSTPKLIGFIYWTR